MSRPLCRLDCCWVLSMGGAGRRLKCREAEKGFSPRSPPVGCRFMEAGSSAKVHTSPKLPVPSGPGDGSPPWPVRPGMVSASPTQRLWRSFFLNSSHVFEHSPFMKFSLISSLECAIHFLLRPSLYPEPFPQGTPMSGRWLGWNPSFSSVF